MNRKRTAILLICAAIFCIGFPFLLEFLYDFGEKYPIIVTNYEQSDILTYATTAVGLSVSLIALYVSIGASIPDFSICHAITEENGSIAICIELYNNSPHDYEIRGFDLCDKRKRMAYVSVSNCEPFILKSKSCKKFFVTTERMKRYLRFLSKTNDTNKNVKNAEYRIRLAMEKSIYIKTGDLFKYLQLGEGMDG